MLESTSCLMPWTGFRCVKSSRAAWIIQIWPLRRCSRGMMPRLLLRQIQKSGPRAGNCWRHQIFSDKVCSIDGQGEPPGSGLDKMLQLGSAPHDITPCPSRMSMCIRAVDSQVCRGTI